MCIASCCTPCPFTSFESCSVIDGAIMCVCVYRLTYVQADERIADNNGTLPVHIAQRSGDRHLERMLLDVESAIGMHVGDYVPGLGGGGDDEATASPRPYPSGDHVRFFVHCGSRC